MRPEPLQFFRECLLPAMRGCGLAALCCSGWLFAASPDNMLVEAVRAADVAAIREALAGGARLNTPQGSTALMIALGDNLPAQHPGIVELLLEHGADVNLRDRRGMTPLLQALEVVS